MARLCLVAVLLPWALAAQTIADFDRLLAAGKYAEAEAPLEAYIAAQPESAEAHYQLGYVYFRLHKIWPSVKALSKSLSLDVRNAEAHKVLGMDFTILSRLDLAAKELRIAVELNPRSAESHYALGRVYYEQASYGAAATELEQAVRLAPDYTKAHHNLGLAYEALNQIERAEAHFRRGVELNERELNPKNRSEWPLINYAGFLNRRGRFTQARELLEQALALNPRSDDAHFQLAKAWRGLEGWRECAAELEKAIEVNPRNPEFFYLLSVAQRRLGRTVDSRASLQRFEQLKNWESDPRAQKLGDPQ